MPGVPQLAAPTEQAEGLPAVPAPVPSAGAFGVQIGQGLEQAGHELFQVGLEQYHKAAEAFAQQKENEFQAGALKLRDQYKNTYLDKAIAGHTPISEALEKLDAQIAASIPSKYGTSLYNNSKLRTKRFIQESIDAHFEQQNKAYQSVQYKVGENGDAAMVAQLALDGAYPADNIEKIVLDRKKQALDYGTKQGMDPATAEAFSKNAAFKVTDALFKTLFDAHSNQPHEVIQSELAKYEKLGLVDAGRLESSQKALQGTASDAWVAKTVANFVRVDADKRTDPKGFIRDADVLEAIQSLPENDPLRKLKTDSLLKEVQMRKHEFANAGAELANVVVRKIQLNGGAIPVRDQDWQDFLRLHPIEAQAISDKVGNRTYQQGQRAKVSAKQADAEAYGSAHYYLSELPQNQIKQMTPASVDKLMRDGYVFPGRVQPSDGAMARAQDYLKKLQTDKLDPIEKQFNSIAAQALEQEYKGDTLKTRSNMGRAHSFLDDTYSAAKAAGKAVTAGDLRQALVNEFTKPGFLQSRPGESYQSPPRPQIALPKAGYYPDPINKGKTRYWDGKAWQ